MSLDYALRNDPAVDRTIRYPAACPMHRDGDEARLDFKKSGWPTEKCSTDSCRRKPTWRATTLCVALHEEFYCATCLPLPLQQLLE